MAITFPIQGYSAVAQNFISRGVASNFYQKTPYLALLGALTLGNNTKIDMLKIGRPDGGEVLSGGIVTPVMRKKLPTVNAYAPRIQGFKTNNTAPRTGTGRVALPDVANKTTNSHGQANQYAAKFHWTHIDTPILIWHEDKIRAANEGTKEGAAISMGQVIDEATEIGMQDQIDWLADKVWTGNPTSQTDDLWDAPLGLVEMTKTNNTYANVNRATAGNEPWQSQVDAALTDVNIKKLLDDANLAKALRTKGKGANLVVTNTTLYQTFKQQILAGGGVVLQNGPVLQMAKMGVKHEVLQLDNALVTYDPSCPANTAIVQDTSVMKFMLHQQFNFKVGEFVDNTKTGVAKDAYDYAYISTRFMFTNDNPFLAVRYSALGT